MRSKWISVVVLVASIVNWSVPSFALRTKEAKEVEGTIAGLEEALRSGKPDELIDKAIQVAGLIAPAVPVLPPVAGLEEIGRRDFLKTAGAVAGATALFPGFLDAAQAAAAVKVTKSELAKDGKSVTLTLDGIKEGMGVTVFMRPPQDNFYIQPYVGKSTEEETAWVAIQEIKEGKATVVIKASSRRPFKGELAIFVWQNAAQYDKFLGEYDSNKGLPTDAKGQPDLSKIKSKPAKAFLIIQKDQSLKEISLPKSGLEEGETLKEVAGLVYFWDTWVNQGSLPDVLRERLEGIRSVAQEIASKEKDLADLLKALEAFRESWTIAPAESFMDDQKEAVREHLVQAIQGVITEHIFRSMFSGVISEEKPEDAIWIGQVASVQGLLAEPTFRTKAGASALEALSKEFPVVVAGSVLDEDQAEEAILKRGAKVIVSPIFSRRVIAKVQELNRKHGLGIVVIPGVGSVQEAQEAYALLRSVRGPTRVLLKVFPFLWNGEKGYKDAIKGPLPSNDKKEAIDGLNFSGKTESTPTKIYRFVGLGARLKAAEFSLPSIQGLDLVSAIADALPDDAFFMPTGGVKVEHLLELFGEKGRAVRIAAVAGSLKGETSEVLKTITQVVSAKHQALAGPSTQLRTGLEESDQAPSLDHREIQFQENPVTWLNVEERVLAKGSLAILRGVLPRNSQGVSAVGLSLWPLDELKRKPQALTYALLRDFFGPGEGDRLEQLAPHIVAYLEKRDSGQSITYELHRASFTNSMGTRTMLLVVPVYSGLEEGSPQAIMKQLRGQLPVRGEIRVHLVGFPRNLGSIVTIKADSEQIEAEIGQIFAGLSQGSRLTLEGDDSQYRLTLRSLPLVRTYSGNRSPEQLSAFFKALDGERRWTGGDGYFDKELVSSLAVAQDMEFDATHLWNLIKLVGYGRQDSRRAVYQAENHKGLVKQAPAILEAVIRTVQQKDAGRNALVDTPQPITTNEVMANLRLNDIPRVRLPLITSDREAMDEGRPRELGHFPRETYSSFISQVLEITGLSAIGLEEGKGNTIRVSGQEVKSGTTIRSPAGAPYLVKTIDPQEGVVLQQLKVRGRDGRWERPSVTNLIPPVRYSPGTSFKDWRVEPKLSGEEESTGLEEAKLRVRPGSTYARVLKARKMLANLQKGISTDLEEIFFLANYARNQGPHVAPEDQDLVVNARRIFPRFGFHVDDPADQAFLTALLEAETQVRLPRLSALPSELFAGRWLESAERSREKRLAQSKKAMAPTAQVDVHPNTTASSRHFLQVLVFRDQIELLHGGKTVAQVLQEYLADLSSFLENGIPESYQGLALQMHAASYNPLHAGDVRTLLARVRQLETSGNYITSVRRGLAWSRRRIQELSEQLRSRSSGDVREAIRTEVQIEEDKATVAFLAPYLKTLARAGLEEGAKELNARILTALQEGFANIQRQFSSDELEVFRAFGEDDLWRVHHGLGAWIRSNFGLWSNSPLAQDFTALRVFHPDSMSSIITTAFHRHLNGRSIDLEGLLPPAGLEEGKWARRVQDTLEAYQTLVAAKSDEIKAAGVDPAKLLEIIGPIHSAVTGPEPDLGQVRLGLRTAQGQLRTFETDQGEIWNSFPKENLVYYLTVALNNLPRSGLEEVTPAVVDLRNLPRTSVARLFDPATRSNSFALDGFPTVEAAHVGDTLHGRVSHRGLPPDWQERLKEIIEEQGALDMTTNQTLLRQLVESGALDERIAELARESRSAQEIYDLLYTEVALEAARIFSDVHRQWPSEGRVSQEASALITELQPLVAAVKTIASGFTKVPNLAVGQEAVAQATRAGVNVNVTLVFGDLHYLDTVEGYIKGLADRVADLKAEGLTDGEIRQDLSRIFSVNSLFVSRIDRAIDKLIDNAIQSEIYLSRQAPLRLLKGKTAVAEGKLIYRIYEAVFQGKEFRTPEELVPWVDQRRIEDLSRRFAALRELGANSQRLLIASSGVKEDQPYDPLLYVLPFLGPGVHNTLPEGTLKALSDFVASLSDQEVKALKSRSLMSEDLPAIEQIEATKERWRLGLLEGGTTISPDAVLRQVHDLVLAPKGLTLRQVADDLRDQGAQSFAKDEQATIDVIGNRIESLTTGLEEVTGKPSLSGLKEDLFLLPSAAASVSGVGVIAGPEGGLPYGVVLMNRVQTPEGEPLPVSFIAGGLEETQALAALGVGPGQIFVVGSADTPTLEAAFDAAKRWLGLFGVQRPIELGVFAPVTRSLRQLFSNLFGIHLEEGSLKAWERFIDRASLAFQA